MHKISHVGNYIGVFFTFIALMALSVFSHAATEKFLDDRTATLWAPYVEWSLENPSYSGNPFDLVASATFIYVNESGTELETRITEMFYAGGTTWKFRFSGTRTGTWTFKTTSSDNELNGHTGTVTVNANSNPAIKGFTTNMGNKWARQVDENGQLETFLPQFRMAFTENPADWSPANFDAEIQVHMGTEGFNSLFFFVAGRWLDINVSGAKFTNNNPDPAMFDVLDNLITKVHGAGGVVHLWYSGDCSNRDQCVQAGFGSNGARSDGEKRLLRYIGARLSPLPGWIMGYGYDIVEDANTDDLRGWGNYLRSKMGWKHLLGARDQWDISYDYSFWPEADWYSKGTYFKGATYNDAVGIFDSDTTVPHSLDERWWTSRISEAGQRRQLWLNMMAGGVSAIWGASGTNKADPYVNPDGFKTYFTFWANRNMQSFMRDNTLSNSYVLKTSDNKNFVFYAVDVTAITYNISNSLQNLTVVAIDAKKPYAEISLGTKAPGSYTWTPPYTSDWALAIGDFNSPTPRLLPSAPVESELSISMN